MANRLSSGSIHVADNSVTAINDAIQQILTQLDELRGLRGDVTIHSPVTIESTVTNNTIVLDPDEGEIEAQFLTLPEITDPGPADADRKRLWVEDFHEFNFFVATDEDGNDLRITRDNVMVVKNTSGSDIAKMKALYVSGASGNVPTVDLADADDSTKMPAIGISFTSIANNDFGLVMLNGVMQGDTSAWSAGDALWVDTVTPGELVNTPPTGASARVQKVALVVRSGPGNSGRLNVGIGSQDFQHRLLGTEHSDVVQAAPVLGDLVVGNATPKWERLAVGSEGDVLTVSGGIPSWEVPTGGSGSSEATDVGNIEGSTQEHIWEQILAGSGISITEQAQGKAIKLSALAGGSSTGAYSADIPPATPGSEDDEFADQSGGVPGGWTEVDFDSNLTVGEDLAGLSLTQTSHASSSQAGIYKAIPSGDFTIWAKLGFNTVANTNNTIGGLSMWEDATSSSGDTITFRYYITNTGAKLDVLRWTQYNGSVTTVHVAAINVNAVGVYPSTIYQRIRRTTTTYGFDVSVDGVNWLRIGSIASLGITPAHFGFFFDNSGTGVTAVMRAQFFRYVSSDLGLSGVTGGNRF